LEGAIQSLLELEAWPIQLQIMEVIEALLERAPQGEDVEVTMPRPPVTNIRELPGVLVVAVIGEIHRPENWLLEVLEMQVDIVL